MKICFIYPSWDNQRTLEVYRKMTPACSGKWKDMEAVIDENEADYCVIIDYCHKKIPPEKAIYVSAHPYIEGYNGYYDLSQKKCVAKLDLKETFGFGEWWLKYDYDYLSALKPMDKIRKVCCIISNSSGGWGRDRRKELIKSLVDKVNVYGRIQGIGYGELGQNSQDNYWFGKEDVLREHRYSVEIDIGITKNYFSERFFDSLLMWCMPLYWGCDNVHEYIPKEAFKYIDLYGNGQDIVDFSNSDEREKHIDAIAEARNLLLNKYQIWARVFYLINGLV